MSLLPVLTHVVGVVLVLHLFGLLVVRWIGGTRLHWAAVEANVRLVAPTAAVLGGVLIANGAVRDIGVELSWIIGVNVTGAIYAIEGDFVAWLQTFATPEATAYFSFVYVFGYVFLLTFPLVIYAAHEEPGPLLATLVAYALNYGVGFLCYVVFVAYGPRNFMPGTVESLLFDNWPQVQFLTSQVNENTNVFPSLHTSLSVSVALLAAKYRSVAPGWFPVAAVGAGSITVATMYLGIHWLIDAVAGVLLAIGSVAGGVRVARERFGDADPQDRRTEILGGLYEQFGR